MLLVISIPILKGENDFTRIHAFFFYKFFLAGKAMPSNCLPWRPEIVKCFQKQVLEVA